MLHIEPTLEQTTGQFNDMKLSNVDVHESESWDEAGDSSEDSMGTDLGDSTHPLDNPTDTEDETELGDSTHPLDNSTDTEEDGEATISDLEFLDDGTPVEAIDEKMEHRSNVGHWNICREKRSRNMHPLSVSGGANQIYGYDDEKYDDSEDSDEDWEPDTDETDETDESDEEDTDVSDESDGEDVQME